jgi:hypothetical protein
MLAFMGVARLWEGRSYGALGDCGGCDSQTLAQVTATSAYPTGHGVLQKADEPVSVESPALRPLYFFAVALFRKAQIR